MEGGISLIVGVDHEQVSYYKRTVQGHRLNISQHLRADEKSTVDDVLIRFPVLRGNLPDNLALLL
jgi:hypothetical protein